MNGAKTTNNSDSALNALPQDRSRAVPNASNKSQRDNPANEPLSIWPTPTGSRCTAKRSFTGRAKRGGGRSLACRTLLLGTYKSPQAPPLGVFSTVQTDACYWESDVLRKHSNEGCGEVSDVRKPLPLQSPFLCLGCCFFLKSIVDRTRRCAS